MGYIVAAIESVILFVVSGILGLANYLLGWTVYITVYQFGNLVGNSGGLLAAWGVVRDVGNIVLLFGFIFMGVSTILNLSHSEFTAKKALPRLIIFAVLLNFSLLAAEGVIDISNALATSVYNQMGGVCPSAQGTVDCAINGGIGGAVMQMSGITSIFTMSKEGLSVFGESQNGITAAVVYAGLIIFVVITTIVLAAAAIMLLIRALVLAFLMVTSPIGFAGMAVPPLQEIAKKWWDELLCQSFFAPVYFLLALVGLKVMEGITAALGGADKTTGNVQSLAAVFVGANADGNTSNVTIAISFALIIGFMIAALMFAKKSSCMGSGMAVAAGGSFAFGTLAFAGRQTVGRASLLAANRIGSSRAMMNSIAGRTLFRVANKGASSSFDYRQGGPGNKALTGTVGNLGSVRKSVQHGMHGIEEDKKKEKVKFAENIQQSHHEKEEQDRLEGERTQVTNRRDQYRQSRQGRENQLQQDVRNEQQGAAAASAQRQVGIAQARADLAQAQYQGRDAQELARLQTVLDGLEQQHIQATQQSQAAIAARQQAVQTYQQDTANRIRGFDRDIQQINTQIADISLDAKRRRYGESLRDSFTARVLPDTIMGHTNHEAGREVIRNAGRSGVDRALDTLRGAINTPAPAAPAAPAGGGAPAGGAHH